MAKMSVFEVMLREGRMVTHPTAGLRGNAKKYAASYWRTWCGVVNKLTSEGYKIGCIEGPRGGTTTVYARFFLYLPSASEMRGA